MELVLAPVDMAVVEEWIVHTVDMSLQDDIVDLDMEILQ